MSIGRREKNIIHNTHTITSFGEGLPEEKGVHTTFVPANIAKNILWIYFKSNTTPYNQHTAEGFSFNIPTPVRRSSRYSSENSFQNFLNDDENTELYLYYGNYAVAA